MNNKQLRNKVNKPRCKPTGERLARSLMAKIEELSEEVGKARGNNRLSPYSHYKPLSEVLGRYAEKLANGEFAEEEMNGIQNPGKVNDDTLPEPERLGKNSHPGWQIFFWIAAGCKKVKAYLSQRVSPFKKNEKIVYGCGNNKSKTTGKVV